MFFFLFEIKYVCRTFLKILILYCLCCFFFFCFRFHSICDWIRITTVTRIKLEPAMKRFIFFSQLKSIKYFFLVFVFFFFSHVETLRLNYILVYICYIFICSRQLKWLQNYFLSCFVCVCVCTYAFVCVSVWDMISTVRFSIFHLSFLYDFYFYARLKNQSFGSAFSFYVFLDKKK